MNNQPMQLNIVKISPMVKKLVILNVAIWVVCQMIFDKMILSTPLFSQYFSFVPSLVVEKFWVWQVVTYMFLHGSSVFHVFFNMISLWFFGSELEYRWGSKFFLTYYLVSGVGAAIIYLLGVIAVGLFRGAEPMVYHIPVIGASGAVFGILVAYAVIFGERIIYFFGVFPMKAKFFILILGGIEVMTLLNEGVGGGRVANLAHLGGMVAGFLFLILRTQKGQSQWRNKKKGKSRRNLRLVVNNKKDNDPNDPKYWN